MIIEVSVVPKSSCFSISSKNNKIRIFLKSAPLHNQANIELVSKLSKVLGRSVRIISGFKSRNKKLEIDISQEEWNDFIQKH